MAVGWRSIAPFSSTPFTIRYLISLFLISMTLKKHFTDGIAASKTFSQVCPAVERKIPTRFPLRSGGTTGRPRTYFRERKTCARSTSTFACAASPMQ